MSRPDRSLDLSRVSGTEADSNAERTLLTSVATGLRLWPVSLFRYSIAYDPCVLEAIRMEAMRASLHGASEAKGACGLLWGAHDEIKVEILACSPLSPSRFLRGSAKDSAPRLLPRLRRGLFKAGLRHDGLVPLGFYRAEEGGETSFSQDEARALAELFPEPWQFVMVLCPRGDQPAKARLFFRLNNGSIGTDPVVYQLSSSGYDAIIDPDLAASQAQRERAAPASPFCASSSQDPRSLSEAAPGLVKFRRATRPQRGDWRSQLRPLLIWSAMAIAVGAAIRFKVWQFYNPRVTVPASDLRAGAKKNGAEEVTFPLRAEIRESGPGAVIRLQWNPSAKPIRNSPVGILSVSDGDLGREFMLKRRELDLGYIDYPAASDEVTFRLMVEDGGGPRQESLVVLLRARLAGHAESGSAAQPRGEIPGEATAQEPAQAPENPRSQGPTERTKLAGDAIIASAGADNSTDSQAGAAQPRHGSSITPAGNTRKLVLSPGPVASIPEAGSAPPLSTASRLNLQQIPPPPPPPISPKAVQPKLEFVAPAAVRRVSPVLPYSLRRLAGEDLRMRVRVDIDANGKVTQCRPLSPPSGVYKYLAGVARETLKQWQFSPGRLGGKPVASETVLDLDFSNER
jgi:Gram-negative bacterial TonB protein C-terminal